MASPGSRRVHWVHQMHQPVGKSLSLGIQPCKILCTEIRSEFDVFYFFFRLVLAPQFGILCRHFKSWEHHIDHIDLCPHPGPESGLDIGWLHLCRHIIPYWAWSSIHEQGFIQPFKGTPVAWHGLTGLTTNPCNAPSSGISEEQTPVLQWSLDELRAGLANWCHRLP